MFLSCLGLLSQSDCSFAMLSDCSFAMPSDCFRYALGLQVCNAFGSLHGCFKFGRTQPLQRSCGIFANLQSLGLVMVHLLLPLLGFLCFAARAAIIWGEAALGSKATELFQKLMETVQEAVFLHGAFCATRRKVAFAVTVSRQRSASFPGFSCHEMEGCRCCDRFGAAFCVFSGFFVPRDGRVPGL